LMTMTRTSILDHSITLAAAALNIHAESSQIHLKISIPSEQSPKCSSSPKLIGVSLIKLIVPA
jgi:hypothetical protein